MKKRDYNICYFHMGDLVPLAKKKMSKTEFEDYFKESGTWLNRYKRHLKSNLGKKTALNKMNHLISSRSFMSIAQADEQIDWETFPNMFLCD